MSRINARLDQPRKTISGRSRSPSETSATLGWFQRVKRTCSDGGSAYRKGYRLLSPVMECGSEENLLVGHSSKKSKKKLFGFVSPFDPCAGEIFPQGETTMRGLPKERHVCFHFKSQAGKCCNQPSIHSSGHEKQLKHSPDTVSKSTNMQGARGTGSTWNRGESRDSGIGQSSRMMAQFPRACSKVKDMALSECHCGELSTSQASQSEGQENTTWDTFLLNVGRIGSGLSNFFMNARSYVINLVGIFSTNPQCPIRRALPSSLSADYRANKNPLCRPDDSSSPKGKKKEKDFQRYPIWFPCKKASDMEDQCVVFENRDAAIAERIKNSLPAESNFLSRLFKRARKAFCSWCRRHTRREQDDISDYHEPIWNRKTDKFVLDAVRCRKYERSVVNKTYFGNVSDENNTYKFPSHSSCYDSLLWTPVAMARDYLFPRSVQEASQESRLDSSLLFLSFVLQPTSVNSPVIDERPRWTSRLRTWFSGLGRRLQKMVARKKDASERRGRKPEEEPGTSRDTGPYFQHASGSSPASFTSPCFGDRMKNCWISFKNKFKHPFSEEVEEEEEEDMHIADPAEKAMVCEIIDHSRNAVIQSSSSENSGYVEQSLNLSAEHQLDSTALPWTANLPIEMPWSSTSPDVCASSSDEEAGHGSLSELVSYVSVAFSFTDSGDTEGEAESEEDSSAAEAVLSKTH